MHFKDKSQITSNQNDPNQVLSLSAHSIQGRRDHMEDNYDIAYQLKPRDKQDDSTWPYEYFYLGIFDGHGGSEASVFAKNHLVKYITTQKHFWSDDDDDVKRAIHDGFRECQQAMRQEMHTWNNPNAFLPSTAGTTASVLFIKNGKFYSGHVGDSRILIVTENNETKNWLATQVTEDHKPELQSEIHRITKCGGEVKDKLGVQRVVWRRPVFTAPPKNCTIHEYAEYLDKLPKEYPVDESQVQNYQRVPFLAIARSLGDFWSIHPFTGLYIVSPEPDISCRPINSQDKAIILASDGLWNVLSSCQASRMLQELNILKSDDREDVDNQYFSIDNYYDVAGDECKNYAKSLVYFAYQTWERKRLRSDNITVVVAMLNDLLNQQSINTQTKNSQASHVGNDLNVIDRDCLSNGIEQLGFTNTFFENIYIDRKPKFSIKNLTIEDEYKTERLENILILPPTVISKDSPSYLQDCLVAPRNYQKLTAASYRRIGRKLYHDAFIYIKHVSDDPDDEIERPTRINKHGKEVRDSSAQATQNIHDFGQSWVQMADHLKGEADENVFDQSDEDDEDEESDDDEEVKKYIDELCNLEELRAWNSGEVSCDSPDDSDDAEINLSRCDNIACPIKSRKSHDGSNPSPRGDKHLLRCLMNSPRRKYSNYQIETRGVKRRIGCDCLDLSRGNNNYRILGTSTRSLQCDIPLC